MVIGAKLDDVFRGAENVKCNNRTEQKLENLLPVLVPAGTDQHSPETPTELRKYCNLVQKTMPFILGWFKDCSSSFAKTIAKFMFYPIRKQMDGVCKTGKMSRGARELLKAGKCGNLAREPIRQCNNKLIDAMLGTSTALPVKNRIYMMCWYV